MDGVNIVTNQMDGTCPKNVRRMLNKTKSGLKASRKEASNIKEKKVDR